MIKKNKIIKYLKDSQQKDGSFLAYISDKNDDFEFSQEVTSVVVTAQILDILNKVKENDEIIKIKSKAFEYIIKQKNKNWTFNLIDNKFKNKKLFPSDLHTTFLALNSITQYKPEIQDGKAIAMFLKVLTDNEVDEGGPYYSFVKNKFNSKIDLGVNIQIAKFLKSQDVDLPKLNNYIEDKINHKKFESDFYAIDLNQIYNCQKFLKDYSVDYIYEDKINDFEFDKIENFYKFVHPKTACNSYIGSKVIHIALKLIFLEANNTHKKIKNKNIKEVELYNEIILEIKKRFDFLGNELKFFANKSLEKIVSFDKNKEIALLPYFFRKSLDVDEKIISDKIIKELGRANVFIWMAYTIYDDFLDDEGDAKMLSVANFCLREYTKIFERLFEKENYFYKIFYQVMDKLDSANAWEVKNCRTLVANNIFYIPEKIIDYNNFEKLAERSLAHGLGPIAILFLIDKKPDLVQVGKLRDFFKFYLIARQLNDDAHDWEDDLKKGHLNSIVVEILKKVETKKTTIDIERDIEKLQKDFWFEMIIDISEKVLENIKKSKIALEEIDIIKNRDVIEKFLIPIENAAKKAITEQKKAIDFLAEYK